MIILEQRNGHWKVADRLTLWESEGHLFTNDLLEKFGFLTVQVLLESDPELELEKNQRFAANINGRKRNYSKWMRRGVAETLALLGAKPEALSTCTEGKAQYVADTTVRELLSNADSERWASLNDVLPLLAEAAPNVFLESIGGASEKPDEPFSGVFAEEVGGVIGRSYTAGLLWALETLAWSPDLLVRVCSILANLAAIDPGGQYANRPVNSLVAILLPWNPQTFADNITRQNAVRCVIRVQPEVAWQLLLQLLPKHHGASFPTHKPKFQSYITNDWAEIVTNGQRWEDEGFYADRALELAGNNPEKLAELVAFYFYIHPQYSSFMYDYRIRLLSPAVRNLEEEKRLALWIEITNRTSNHRKYADSDAWKIPEDMLQQLEEVADQIKPQEPEVRHRRLFSGVDIDLYEDTDNFEEQEQQLLKKRIAALKEIEQRGGATAVKRFWHAVESPHEVGNACGADDILAKDTEYLPFLLESDEAADNRFAAAYIWRRFHTRGGEWIEEIDRSHWSIKTKAEFFSQLPTIHQVWERAESELGIAHQAEYWKRVRFRPNSVDVEDFVHALEQLLANGRADMAIQCLWLGKVWADQCYDLALQALEQFDPEKNRIDAYAIQEIFKHLQEVGSIDEERLATMEWCFLPLLDKHSGGASPRTLYRQMAERPDLYCNVIQAIYRSKNKASKGYEKEQQDEVQPDIDETKASMARSAYKLLMHWNHPPGANREGGFSGEQLKAWVATVEESCRASGHWEVASHHIGEVLFYARQSDDDLWYESVCELLDSRDTPEFRRGLSMRIFNSRGVFGFSEGNEENEIAEKWERIAAMAEGKGFGRLGSTLRELGRSYREDAKRMISEHRNEFD